MPRGDRATRVRTELADALHLEHGADQHRAMLRVGVDQALRAGWVHHVPRVDVALVHPVRRAPQAVASGSIAGGPGLMPVVVGDERRPGIGIELRRGCDLLRRCDVVGRLEHGAGVRVLRVWPGKVDDPDRRGRDQGQQRQGNGQRGPSP